MTRLEGIGRGAPWFNRFCQSCEHYDGRLCHEPLGVIFDVDHKGEIVDFVIAVGDDDYCSNWEAREV